MHVEQATTYVLLQGQRDLGALCGGCFVMRCSNNIVPLFFFKVFFPPVSFLCNNFVVGQTGARSGYLIYNYIIGIRVRRSTRASILVMH